MATTARRPSRSETCPNSSSDGMSTIAYTAKINARTIVEKPNRIAYTAYSGVARFALSNIAENADVTTNSATVGDSTWTPSPTRSRLTTAHPARQVVHNPAYLANTRLARRINTRPQGFTDCGPT